MTALVTGAGGLVGSAATRMLLRAGYEVFGIENDMRSYFFGPEGSTATTLQRLLEDYPTLLRVHKDDIRSSDHVEAVVERAGDLELVIHTAAQPSHDWAAREPLTDFGVNAVGTLNLLEAVRKHAPEASFCHISTSKVYGDTPNRLPLEKQELRLDLPPEHPFYDGIDTSMSIDQSLHSLFGVSKAAGDLLVQEYGRYFDMNTICLRPGCVTGAAHAGVELHGFLAYLMKCAVTGREYTVYGYQGKQVRCNIEASDLVSACLAYHGDPQPGMVFNIGGGRLSQCSMLEAIDWCEEISGASVNWRYEDRARIGDHRWWISNNNPFQQAFPTWSPTYNVPAMLAEIYDENAELWQSQPS